MTRDETVALFLECEAKRAEARAAVLAGNDKDGADAAGHDAAKAHWNAWAEPLLTERKALEEAGTWKSRHEPPACLCRLWGLRHARKTGGGWNSSTRLQTFFAMAIKSLQLPVIC